MAESIIQQRDPSIPLYPEVKIDFDVKYQTLSSYSYMTVYSISGQQFLSLCSASANVIELGVLKSIEFITHEMNKMAQEYMNKVLTETKLGVFLPG